MTTEENKSYLYTSNFKQVQIFTVIQVNTFVGLLQYFHDTNIPSGNKGLKLVKGLICLTQPLSICSFYRETQMHVIVVCVNPY
jgi:hypothetical protein